MSENFIKTGLLAFGMSGKVFHAPFITHHPGFQFTAVLERHNKTAKQLYPHVISYDNLEDFINDKDIELIVVNTPNDLHFEHVRNCLLAGKHVLVEKPVSVSSAELRELFLISERMERNLLAYQNRRWDSDFLSVVEILNSKVLGSLVEAHFRYDRYKIGLGAKSFKETPGHPGNGLLYDLGPHLIDQVISIFGKPVSFNKITSVHRPGSSVVDYFSYYFLFPGQVNVFVTASLLAADSQAAFVLHGTHGSYIKYRSDIQESQLMNHIGPENWQYGIEDINMKGRLTTIVGEVKTISDQPSEIRGDYPGIYEAIYQTIRNNAPFPVRKEELIWQIEILES